MVYELHCFSAINGDAVSMSMIQEGNRPFKHWFPEKMQMLF